MSLTPAQDRAANAASSVVAIAGAGTGKTHMLAERYLYHLREQQHSPLQVVAVTFTNKAATELRSRIRRRLKAELPDDFDRHAELEAAQIGTLHSLAARICREHPEAADVPPDFQLLEDIEAQLWQADNLTAAIAELPARLFATLPYSRLQTLLATLLADPWASDRAFQQGNDWSALVEQLRRTVREPLLASPDWRAATDLLASTRGEASDKIEAIRQEVVAAVEDLVANERVAAAIACIQGITLRGGSTKKWPAGDLKAVKAALTHLRDSVKAAAAVGAFQTEPDEADRQLAAQLPVLRDAYQRVRDNLRQRQQQARWLSYAESEIAALRALAQPAVRDYYRDRWQAFLVDEFQDINPTQAAMLESLTAGATLTIVGDPQQSIYSFRRAEVAVFNRFRDRIQSAGGGVEVLDESFRARPQLNAALNRISAQIVPELHQPLRAKRADAASDRPPVRAWLVGDSPDKSNSEQRRQVEAQHLASQLKQAIADGWPVFDARRHEWRPLQAGDIALLSRTWDALEVYADALAAADLPVALAGGGNLLATREAKDAWALLSAIADRRDDIALVATLRSPHFALSDRQLTALATLPLESESSWWQRLAASQQPEFQHPLAVLQELWRASATEPPSRLLQRADWLTGYTAAIANLPGGDRRLADWQAFRLLVQQLETGPSDLFGLVRRLRPLFQQGQGPPRPPLAAGDAITLGTIHSAKGLEWPLVAIADLARQPQSEAAPLYSDPDWGLAFPIVQAGQTQAPLRYRYLQRAAKERAAAERRRLLYVALTRARDYLWVSATEAKQAWNVLAPGLDAAAVAVKVIPFEPELALPPVPPAPAPPASAPTVLVGDMGAGLSELPVTALGLYARCPRRFQWEMLAGHPGVGRDGEPAEWSESAGGGRSLALGNLVHRLLERQVATQAAAEALAARQNAADCAAEAWQLVQVFRNDPQFAQFQQGEVQYERWLSLPLAGLRFNGRADLSGPGWVLDYKTDRQVEPQPYRFQLWAYATALGVERAYIAYLRSPAQLHEFTAEDLAAIAPEAEALARSLRRGPYPTQPTLANCRICPYLAICEDGRAAIAT